MFVQNQPPMQSVAPGLAPVGSFRAYLLCASEITCKKIKSVVILSKIPASIRENAWPNVRVIRKLELTACGLPCYIVSF